MTTIAKISFILKNLYLTIPVMTNVTFRDLFDLLISIPSGITIFFKTSLFLSGEENTEDLFALFLSNVFIYFSNNQIQRIYNMNSFIITIIFDCDVSNVININAFL